MSEQETSVYRSDQKCWRCHRSLLRLDPLYKGWRYYCQHCECLTMSAADVVAESHRRETEGQSEGSCGFVAAVQGKLAIEFREDKP